MTTKRREFLMAPLAALGAAVPLAAESIDPRQIVSQLSGVGRKLKDEYEWPAIPEPEEFCELEAAIEFMNELRVGCGNESNVPLLMQIAVFERSPSIRLMAVASMRVAAPEVMTNTVKLLEFRQHHWRYICKIRWAAAVTLGLMGPAAIEALPALRVRAERELYVDPLAAVEWAIAEIGGAE